MVWNVCLSMILPENRFPLFGIMLDDVREGSSVRLARPAWPCRRTRRTRPDRHDIAGAAVALVGLDQRAAAVRRGAAASAVGFDACVSGHGVAHDTLAVDNVLALADHE